VNKLASPIYGNRGAWAYNGAHYPESDVRYRTVLLILVIAAASAFLYLNWRMFAAPATFNFLFASVTLPLGVVIIGLLGSLAFAFAVYVAFWQGTLLRDFRRLSKELETQRKHADDAESSRLTELSTLMRLEMSKLAERFEAALVAVESELRDTEHSIAATLGEMDDRMQKGAIHSTSP
jgi:hypothetical protein